MSVMVVDLKRVGDGLLNTAESRQSLQLDKYPQQLLENNKIISTSTPSISTFSGSDFLNKLGETILNSFQLQTLTQQKKEQSVSAATSPSLTSPTLAHMDFDTVPNHVIIDSSTHFSGMDELQKQLEYDKFMNEIWIGIVFTLILISMIFCICSCFLYHQFRTWKRNYNTNVNQSRNLDVESMKLNPDIDDPVPDYTLVSGLPSYEAALELLKTTPKPCVIMYPSLFSVFNKNEKSSNNVLDVSTKPDTTVLTSDRTRNQQQPLINDYTKQTCEPLTPTEAVVKSLQAYDTCNFSSAGSDQNKSNDCLENRIPSYAEAITTTTQSTTTTTTTTKKTNQTSSPEITLLNDDISKPLTSLTRPPTMLNKTDQATATTTTTTTTTP